MMKAGLWTGFFLLEPSELTPGNMFRLVGRLRKAGFQTGEMDERNALELFIAPSEGEAVSNAQLFKSMGFFSQIHAPKPEKVFGGPDCVPGKPLPSGNLILERLCRICRIMGVDTLVTHPFITPAENPVEPMAQSLKMLQNFVSIAANEGIKVALENQVYPVDLDFYLREVPGLRVNLDFAHAVAVGLDVPGEIRKYGRRLAGLHVSDSDGRKEDYHIMPFSGIVDWREVMRALEEVGYSGNFHLEIVHERSESEGENDETARKAFGITEQILGGRL